MLAELAALTTVDGKHRSAVFYLLTRTISSTVVFPAVIFDQRMIFWNREFSNLVQYTSLWKSVKLTEDFHKLATEGDHVNELLGFGTDDACTEAVMRWTWKSMLGANLHTDWWVTLGWPILPA